MKDAAPNRLDEYRNGKAKKATKGGVVFLTIFGLFWCGMVGTLDAVMIPRFFRQLTSTWFEPAPARIIKSEVHNASSSGDGSYGVNIEYKYKVGGSEYTGTLYSFDTSTSSDSAWARQTVAAYPVGSEQTCYYDSAHPSRAVLSRGLHGSDFTFLMFMTPFNMIGAAFLSAPFFIWRQRHRPTLLEPRVIDRFQNREFYSMNNYSPLMTFLGAFFLSTFLGIFAVVFPSGFHPSLLKVVLVWGGALAISIAAALSVYFKRQSGRYDLVLDYNSRTVTIPAMHNRSTKEIIPMADVQSITSAPLEKGDGDDKKTEWHVKLATRHHTDFLLSVATSEEDAQRIATTLNQKIRR